MTLAMSNAPPRGARRRQRTRSAIITAGQRLFAVRALESVSIDDIVAAADVAKGSFYNHFDHKEGLADTIVDVVQGDVEFHISVANRDIADAAVRVTRALAVVMTYARRHPDRVQAMLALSRQRTDVASPLNAGVTHDIRSGLASGRFKGVGLTTGVLIVLGLVRVAVDHVTLSQPRPDHDVIVADLGAAILRALGVPSDAAAPIALAATEILPQPEPSP